MMGGADKHRVGKGGRASAGEGGFVRSRPGARGGDGGEARRVIEGGGFCREERRRGQGR